MITSVYYLDADPYLLWLTFVFDNSIRSPPAGTYQVEPFLSKEVPKQISKLTFTVTKPVQKYFLNSLTITGSAEDCTIGDAKNVSETFCLELEPGQQIVACSVTIDSFDIATGIDFKIMK